MTRRANDPYESDRVAIRGELRRCATGLAALEPRLGALPDEVPLDTFPGDIRQVLVNIAALVAQLSGVLPASRLGNDLRERLSELQLRLRRLNLELTPSMHANFPRLRELESGEAAVAVTKVRDELRACVDLCRGDRPPGWR